MIAEAILKIKSDANVTVSGTEQGNYFGAYRLGA